MPIPTGGPEDDIDLDGPDNAAPDGTDSSPYTSVSPETQREAERISGEIVKLAQEVEIMAQTRAKLEKALGRVEGIAKVMDGGLLKHIPGVKDNPFIRRIPVSVDALTGLIPFAAGDAAMMLPGLWIVGEAKFAGMSWWECFKMLSIVIADFGLGALPVVGDYIDPFFKSNKWNAERFRRYVREHISKHQDAQGRLDNAHAQKRFQDSRDRSSNPPDINLDEE